MLYLIAIILGILLGIAAGGRLSNLLNVKFEKIWIIVSAFIIQTMLRILTMNGFEIAAKYAFVIQFIVFCMLLAGFWFNRHYFGMCIIGLGCILNALVMTLNGGKMPVGANALTKAGMDNMLNILQTGMDGKHIIVNGTTRLAFLSDVINLPPFIGAMMPIVSVGDLVIALGVFILVLFTVIDKKIYMINSNLKKGGYMND